MQAKHFKVSSLPRFNFTHIFVDFSKTFKTPCLSKILFSLRDENEIQALEKSIERYCDYMNGTRGQKKRAILVQLSMLMGRKVDGESRSIEEIGNDFVAILHSLMAAKMIGLAGRFLYVCQTQLKVP